MFIRRYIVGQFRQPRGWVGAVVGAIMAHRPSNRRRNAWSVALLDIAEEDRVLEIGCGPGIAIADIAARLTTGTVTGIDHSGLMIDKARLKNQEAIAAGRIALMQRGTDDLPEIAGGYTKVLAINVLQFVPKLGTACAAIAAVMAPGGVLAVTYQPRMRFATHDDAVAFGDHLAVAFSHAGFTDIRMEELALRPAPAICVIGRKGSGSAGKTKKG